MVSWLFCDVKSNIHADRFINTMRKLNFNIQFVTYQTFENASSDVLFVAEIDKIPEKILYSKRFLVGVSWAYDIERNLESQIGRNKLKQILSRLDLIIVDCQVYYEKVLSLGVQTNKLWLMPYGVDLSQLDYVSKRIKSGGKTTFYSNRKWEENYGQETILCAAESLASLGYNFEITFSNSGSLRKKLLDLYDPLVRRGYVRYIGEISEFTNIQSLKKSDFFLSASVKDGWSVSILESMALGTPVLVTSIEQNLDLIANEVNGITFAPGSVSSLIASCKFAINLKGNPEKFQEIAYSARKTIELKADYLKNMRQLMSLIRDSIN
jgi:glycosyltransferase involved in cell wall biosynthesis